MTAYGRSMAGSFKIELIKIDTPSNCTPTNESERSQIAGGHNRNVSTLRNSAIDEQDQNLTNGKLVHGIQENENVYEDEADSKNNPEEFNEPFRMSKMNLTTISKLEDLTDNNTPVPDR
jgi:hypothetical protein